MLKKEIEDIKQVLIGRKMSFRDIVLEEKRLEEEDKKVKGSTKDTGGWVLQMQVSKAMEIKKKKCNVMIMGVEE